MSEPVGSEHTRLIVVRGNSAAGKSSVAAGIRDRYGRGLAIVGQDTIRRHILKENDVPGGVNIGLIDTMARYCLNHGYHVIIEGILHAERYGEMLTRLCHDHRGQTLCVYLDIPWEETLARHALRPQARTFGEAEMRHWYQPRDLLPDGIETLIDDHSTIDQTVQLIMAKADIPQNTHHQ